jgi:hypothetical protein
MNLLPGFLSPIGGEDKGEGATGRSTPHLACTAEAAPFRRRRDPLPLRRGEVRSVRPVHGPNACAKARGHSP